MAAYNILLNLLHTLAHEPAVSAVKQLMTSSETLPVEMHQQVQSADLREWANAMHSSQADSINSHELADALRAVGKFSEKDILQEVKQHFINVSVHIDTLKVREQYSISDAAPVIQLKYQQGSHNPETKPEQGVHNADLDGSDKRLIPDCTIDWQFCSSKEGDSLQLKAFYVKAMDGQEEAPHCTKIDNSVDASEACYRSHGSRVKGQSALSYFFDFTINGGSQLFRMPQLNGELVG